MKKRYCFLFAIFFSWLLIFSGAFLSGEENDEMTEKLHFEKWISAWESKNLDDYINFYSLQFHSKTSNMDFTAWKNHKANIFRRGQSITIGVHELKITQKDDTFLVEFFQDYQAGSYQDYGKKTMIWRYEGAELKIINEEWYAAERKILEPPVIIPEPPKEIVTTPPDTTRYDWTAYTGQVPFEYINFLFPIEQNYDEYLIVVEKRVQQAALYRFQDNFETIELLKTYTISSGQAQGNKQKRDDLKTPEGLYRTIEWIPDERLPAKYGSGAFVLDYPNKLDRVLRKTGYGIWIHGSDIDMVPYDTEGCVRFENHEITYFHEELNFNTVPVIINDGLEWTLVEDLKQEVENILSLISAWQESWQEQDISKYLSFYHSNDFVTYKQKMNYTQWSSHKRRIFNPRKPIKVDLTDFSYYYADNLLLVSFYQDYVAESLKSFGRKDLVLRRVDNTWVIIQEEWMPATRKVTIR